MFDKQLKDLEYEDIYDLIYNRKEDEGYKLDYKAEPQNIDEFSKKVIHVISSFANVYGGYLILGVEEKDRQNKIFEITGVSKIVKNKHIVEWINQTISSNIEPKIYYPDPKIINIPNSEKVIVVFYIPESINKPHFNNHDNKYYTRQNDSSKPANHYQIRDMFETTRRHYDEFNDFLIRRNIFDEENPNFALTTNSKRIKSDVFTSEKNVPIPIFLASFIPKLPNNEIVTIQKNDLIKWLENNSKGNNPLPNLSIFPTHSKEINLNGISFWNYQQKSYIEFLNNGYFETGLSDTFFWIWKPQNSEKELYTLHITWCVGYIMEILYFAKKYYNFINYNEEIILQLSFRNLLNFIVEGFNQTNGRGELSPIYNDIPKNLYHNNFKITERFIPSSLDDNSILEISKYIAEKLLLSCGVNDLTLCFIEDKLDINLLSHIRNI